jgi:beta-glucosidase
MEAGLANGTLTTARLDDMAIRNVMAYYFVGLDNGLQASMASANEQRISRETRAQHSAIIRKNGANSLVLLKNVDSALPLKTPGIIAIFGAHAGPAMAGPSQPFSVEGSGPIYQGHLATGTGSAEASFSYLITPYAALTYRASQDGTMVHWILNNTYTSTTASGMGSGGGGSVPSGTGSDNSTSIISDSPSSTGSSAGPNTSSSRNSNSTAGAAAGGASADGASAGSASAGSASASSASAGGASVDDAATAGQSDTAVQASITNYAESSDVCLVFLNALAGEGADRTELYNDEQDTLVTSVASECNNTIVVLNTVGPRLMEAWIDNENVTAVLYGSMLGQESGNSIVDVLYGDVNPSGKLIYTIGKNASDYPVKICETAQCDFTEGVYIDYKYFDAYNLTPRYPFGYGLSYTLFEYGSTIVSSSGVTAGPANGALTVGGREDLWDTVVTVTTRISNNGTVDGADVAQLYLSYPSAANQPIRQLRGFDKLDITAGSSALATFSLRRRDISFWDVTAQEWSVASGEYTVSIGSSSRDLRSNATFTV